MTGNADDLTALVLTSISDAIGVEEDEIRMDSTLIDELGAESIDMLDVMFRIHRDSGVDISVNDVAAMLQGGIPDDEFGDEDEVVTEVGLAHLEKVLPQFDRSQLNGRPLRGEQVLGLVTVGNLVDLVHLLAARQQVEQPAEAGAAQ
ncbi:acyl carrier protein [Nocardia sp. 2]|uniref:Acyl carrier protein n=1 Tax=Nocardia acididurans TaxID=2802282 RepID=A0ABS1M8S8_9NOCA|nr:phosphopantetheine-binding protein [Nocardia acididurans]MBL1076440.1 acyl carrier protein [Nocardia acididurans]